MKILAQRDFCQLDTEALHPFWSVKIVLRCPRISFLERKDMFQECLKLVLPALWIVGGKGKFLVAAVMDWSINPDSLQAGNKECMQLDIDQTSESSSIAGACPK